MLTSSFTALHYSMAASASAATVASGENSVLSQMVAYGIKEIRQPFESMVFGACVLSYIGERRTLQQHTGKAGEDNCRDLYRQTETEKERAEREAAGKTIEQMKIWPNWIKNARFVAGRLQDLEKAGRGPSPVIRKEFPAGKVEDLAEMCRRLVDLAFGSGLRDAKVNDFKLWISK